MSGLFKETPFPDQPPIPRRKRARGRLQEIASSGRLMLLLGAFGLCFTALALRMGQIATAATAPEPPPGSARAAAPDRAQLLDRNGRVLASTLQTWEVIIRPYETARAGGISPDALNELGRIFPQLDRGRLRRLIEAGQSRFYYVSRRASPLQWKKARDLGIIGMEAVPRADRVYPAGRLVAHVIGGVNIDNKGVAGIERGLDERISEGGAPISLSIDLRLQNALRTTLSEALSEFAALGAASLLMDVRTGELLAMVSMPDFDPNHRPAPPSDPDLDVQAASPLFNRVTQGAYDLGSIFKLLTAAMALESGAADVGTLLDARYPIRRGGFTIDDYRGKRRFLTLEEVIRYSSNIGAVRIAELLGPDRQQRYLSRFGIGGEPVLPEFDPSELQSAIMPAKWDSAESATVAYGHGISVTLLHYATALGSVVNDGCRVTMTLLKQDPTVRRPCQRVVRREVSDNIRALARQVAELSSGRSANIAGYQIGGKTGTAYKVKPSGGYDLDKRFNSFVAFWPTDAPKYLLMVSLDDPKLLDGTRRLPLAGRTAAPVAGRAIERIAPLLGIAPSDRFRPSLPPEEEISEGAPPIFLDDAGATQ